MTMNTLTNFVLGRMGARRALPALGESAREIALPVPSRDGTVPLMSALDARRSERNFATTPLPRQLLSELLWAADGVNRGGAGRTAPSALDAQDVLVYVALPEGTYRFDAAEHVLRLVAGADVRRLTGYQDFVDQAPLDLVYVHDEHPMSPVSVLQRTPYAYTTAGAIAQNVYLFCAAHGLGCVLRAWIDREAVAQALGLGHNQHVLLSQTVGYPLDARARSAG
jgi:nitroreductase